MCFCFLFFLALASFTPCPFAFPLLLLRSGLVGLRGVKKENVFGENEIVAYWLEWVCWVRGEELGLLLEVVVIISTYQKKVQKRVVT